MIVARNEVTVLQVLESWQQQGWKAHGIAVDVSIAEGRLLLDKTKMTRQGYTMNIVPD